VHIANWQVIAAAPYLSSSDRFWPKLQWIPTL